MADNVVQQELWRIIGQNMGTNSLELFQQFYTGDDISEQVDGARNLFAELFGKQKAEERLSPVYQKLRNYGVSDAV